MLTRLLQMEAVMAFLWRVVDGDESSGTVDHLGRGRGGGGPFRAVLIGAGVLSIGAGDVGALPRHGTLAVATAHAAHGVAVIVIARDTGFEGLAEPLLVGVRGQMGKVLGAKLNRQRAEVGWVFKAGGGIVPRPTGLEGWRTASVIELVEAIVEPNTHAAVDAEIVMRLTSRSRVSGWRK